MTVPDLLRGAVFVSEALVQALCGGPEAGGPAASLGTVPRAESRGQAVSGRPG